MQETALEHIDWGDPACPISTYFTVKDAIWLPSWSRLATAADGLDDDVKRRLFFFLTGAMDDLRAALGKPIVTHVTYRPPAYNVLVGGAKGSAHQCLGEWAAMDWHLQGSEGEVGCGRVRQRILDLGMLEHLGLRMEDRPGSDWVHTDSHPVGTARFFKP
jgi:Peptidase M15